MGDSVDWKYEYFTMDERLSAVVTDTFVPLYEEGLIYRGKRLVNWDPVLLSAVSDLEVENEERDGTMWHILYPFSDGPQADANGQPMAACTSRRRGPRRCSPTARWPCIPTTSATSTWSASWSTCRSAIAAFRSSPTTYVDREFGSGCVKITGAHDFNDYAGARCATASR